MITANTPTQIQNNILINNLGSSIMGKTTYSRNPSTPKVARASGKDIRAHYKNTYETAKAIKGMTIPKAKKYLNDVLAHRRCIPYTKHYRGIGRTGQAT